MHSKQEPRRGSKKSQRINSGGAFKRGWDRRLRSSDCCNHAVRCITLWALSLDGALKRSPLPGNTFLSTPCRAPGISNSSLWRQRALQAQVSLANLCCPPQSPRRWAACSREVCWCRQCAQVVGTTAARSWEQMALNPSGGGEIITRADSFGVGFKQMGIWSGNWLQLWGWDLLKERKKDDLNS